MGEIEAMDKLMNLVIVTSDLEPTDAHRDHSHGDQDGQTQSLET